MTSSSVQSLFYLNHIWERHFWESVLFCISLNCRPVIVFNETKSQHKMGREKKSKKPLEVEKKIRQKVIEFFNSKKVTCFLAVSFLNFTLAKLRRFYCQGKTSRNGKSNKVEGNRRSPKCATHAY